MTAPRKVAARQGPIDDVPGTRVDWNGDGTYTPVCATCPWSGKPRNQHHVALAAIREHSASKLHEKRSA